MSMQAEVLLKADVEKLKRIKRSLRRARFANKLFSPPCSWFLMTILVAMTSWATHRLLIVLGGHPAPWPTMARRMWPAVFFVVVYEIYHWWKQRKKHEVQVK